MQSSLSPGFRVIKLSDIPGGDTYYWDCEDEINIGHFGDNFRNAFSRGHCRSLEEFKKEKRMVGSGKLDSFYQYQDLTKKSLVTLVQYRILICPQNGDMEYLLHELEIVRDLKHHRILQFYETAAKFPRKYYCIYEPFACFLSNLIQERNEKIYQLPVIKNVMLQLFEALNYLHEHSVMHRNIQPQSIAFTSSGCLKVCNFRNALWLWEGCSENNLFSGDFSSQSPELLMRSKICNTPVDIWAAACILVHLLMERPFKFYATSVGGILPQVFSIFGFPTKENWHDFFEVSEFNEYDLYKMQKPHSYIGLDLYFTRAERPQNQRTMDLLQQMFQLDPKNRPSAKECADHIFFAEEPTACMEDELAQCVNVFLSRPTAQKVQTEKIET